MTYIPALNRPKDVIDGSLFMAQKFELSGGIVIYQGYSNPGANESGNVWSIKQIVYDASDGISGILWASGNNEFDKKWVDRGSYNYL